MQLASLSIGLPVIVPITSMGPSIVNSCAVLAQKEYAGLSIFKFTRV